MTDSACEQQPPDAGLEKSRDDIRSMSYYLALWVAIVVVLGMLTLPPVLVSNDKSRWDTVWSLTHGKGYVIDEAPYGGVDRIKRDGHFYSSKPPLLPTAIAGVVEVIRAVTGWDLPKDDKYIVRIIVFFLNVVPLSALVILYGRMLQRIGTDKLTAFICLLTAAGGTYLTTYSVTLNNHTIGAFAYFMTIYCLCRIIYDGQTHNKYFLATGLFASWTVCNELPAGLMGLIVFVWLYRKHPSQTLKYFIPPALAVLGMFLFTIYLATDSFIPYYLKSGLYRYEGSYWNEPKGIDGNGDSRLFYLFNLVVGHHGLFSLTPILLVGFIGLLKDEKWRGLHTLTLTLTAAVLAFLTIFKSPDYGGWCHGPRWIFWLIPGFLLGLPKAVSLFENKKGYLWLTYVALIISMISVGLGWKSERKGPWENPWTRDVMQRLGMIDY